MLRPAWESSAGASVGFVLRKPWSTSSYPHKTPLCTGFRRYSDRTKAEGDRQSQQRYSILDLQQNRLWTHVAGLDPRVDRDSAEVWEKFRDITANAYFQVDLDVSTPWNSQEPRRKKDAYENVESRVAADVTLRQYPGLRNHDLIAYRLCHFHRNQRANLQKIIKEGRLGERSAFIPEIVQAMQKGEIRLLSKPHLHQLDTLADQGARVALSRATKRQQSNELHWQKKRLALKDEPADPQRDLQEVAQAPDKRSAGQRRRWQRWREALRSGDLPIFTRLHSEDSRRKHSEKATRQLSEVEWTSEMREMKRRVGAIGLEKQRQAREARAY